MKTFTSIIIVTFLSIFLQSANASSPLDDLTQCLKKATVDADRNDLVAWTFATLALHPELKSMVSISDQQRQEMARKVGKLIEELLTKTCKLEAQQAYKTDGAKAIEVSFQALGQISMVELYSNPKVAAGFSDINKYADNKKINSVLQGDQSK
jgi:hypothetical protein